ncbi:hypothetical protein FJY70_05100, partial [candidate division WOR-3 bacterium]|nr:hypothetical protein [candidate division WOR-3 bacterium]
MLIRTCRIVLCALLVMLALPVAGIAVPLPQAYNSDSLSASFSGTSLLGYRLRRLVRRTRTENRISCSYDARGGGRFLETMERGFAEWDVSGIPDTAVIDSVFCVTSCSWLSAEMQSVRLFEMTERPSTTLDPVLLFADAGDGELYGVYPNPGVGRHVRKLSDAARSGLQSSLSLDWFAIGYTGVGLATDWKIHFSGYLSDSAPKLMVYYSLGASPRPDVGCRVLLAPTGVVDSGSRVTPAC